MVMPRKRPLKDPKQPYAYIWRYKNEVIWVGHGKNNRCRPRCKSSWSGRPPALIKLLEEDHRSIIVEVLPCNSKEEAVSLEKELIAKLHPRYNTAPQAGGWKGMHTPDGLRRISESNTGIEVSDEVREGRRLRMLGNQNLLGHKHSDITKAKIGAKGRGCKPSILCRAKASERMSERNRVNPPRKGKHCSEEHKRKLSEAAKRRNVYAPQI